MEEKEIVMPGDEAMKEEVVSSGFTWSIVSLVFCCSGLLGLIFSIIANKKVKKAIAMGAPLEGRLKSAKIMAKIALIISIVSLVFYVIYGIIMGIAAAAFASQALNGEWEVVGSIASSLPIM